MRERREKAEAYKDYIVLSQIDIDMITEASIYRKTMSDK
jgi:hypothetical protein